MKGIYRYIMFNRPHKAFFYALLLCVYAAFFSVQFFFNFDGVSDPQGIFSYFSNTHSGQNRANNKDAAILKCRPVHHSSHISRMNKRFQQEDMPVWDHIYSVIPERYVPIRTPDYADNDTLSAADLCHKPLRGPPVVC